MPDALRRRTSTLYEPCSVFLPVRSWLDDLGQDVRLAQDEHVLAVDLELGAAVLGVEDLVTLCDVERNALLAVLVPAAVTDRDDLAALRLLLRGVREHEA